MSADEHPDELRYTREHEWFGRNDNGRVRVGITSYAQEALGDIVYVTLPEIGTMVSAGGPLGEVESTKSVSDIYAPIGGVVVARNEALDDRPELVNSDPYGDGWMVEIETTDGDKALTEGDVLDAAGYRTYVSEL
ncbi:MAG: glycine cleavage system protein [Frankiales bacterium]|nr:glycine cleavage system protein [Frankiales bacterium]